MPHTFTNLAIHEAGHIVACDLYHVRYGNASLIPNGFSDGHVLIERPRTEASARARIDVALAGGEAERIYDGTDEPRIREFGDMYNVKRWFDYYVDNDTEELADFMRRRRRIVREALEQNWYAVLSVAQLLKERQTICRHQAKSAILQAKHAENSLKV
jgi:hypothetical protein